MRAIGTLLAVRVDPVHEVPAVTAHIPEDFVVTLDLNLGGFPAWSDVKALLVTVQPEDLLAVGVVLRQNPEDVVRN